MEEKHVREIKDICLLEDDYGDDVYSADCTVHFYVFHRQLLNSPVTLKGSMCSIKNFPIRLILVLQGSNAQNNP